MGFLLREAGDGIRKNSMMSFASVTTVAVSLFVLSLIGVVALNMQHMMTTLESQIHVVAFLSPDFDRSERDRLIAAVETLDGVAEVHYVTREEALQRLRRQFGQSAGLLDGVLERNPLRDSIEVRVPDSALAGQVASRLGKFSEVEKVRHQQDTVKRLHDLSSAARVSGIVLGVIFALATLLLISNTIRLSVFSRRREIGVMKLVGATDSLIRWPFFLEGAVLGLFGAAAASLAVWSGYTWLVGRAADSLPFLPLIPAGEFTINMMKVLLIAGALIGAAGSVVSVRRHLRV